MRKNNGVTVITVNAAGASRKGNANPQFLGQIIAKEKPDIIGIQEAVVCWNENNKQEDNLEEFSMSFDKSYHKYFIPTLDSRINSYPDKWSSNRFKKYTHIQQGNGLLISKNYQIVDLWSDKPGQPVPITISEPTLFLGSRNTEPRQIVITKLKNKQNNTFYFAITHLTTLEDERTNPEVYKQASNIRIKQIENIIYILSQLKTKDPIILVGDFNASLESAEMEKLQKKFIPITKTRSELGEITHVEHKIFIDHIFFSPKERITEITKDACYLIDLKAASDHRAVVAKLEFNFK